MPVAYTLSRREWVRLFGAAAALGFSGSVVSAARSPSCIVRPEQTEGPYFLDEQLNRSDIRADPRSGSVSEGIALDLSFHISRLEGGNCLPFANTMVDVWHCNAHGQYSGVDNFGAGASTRGQAFLRGYQITDENGTARFKTIVPGWYPGRAVHIHFKLRPSAPTGEQTEFTSQLYFEQALLDQVHRREPYARKGQRHTTNLEDGIFRRGGRDLILPLSEKNGGYAGTFEIGIETNQLMGSTNV